MGKKIKGQPGYVFYEGRWHSDGTQDPVGESKDTHQSANDIASELSSSSGDAEWRAQQQEAITESTLDTIEDNELDDPDLARFYDIEDNEISAEEFAELAADFYVNDRARYDDEPMMQLSLGGETGDASVAESNRIYAQELIGNDDDMAVSSDGSSITVYATVLAKGDNEIFEIPKTIREYGVISSAHHAEVFSEMLDKTFDEVLMEENIETMLDEQRESAEEMGEDFDEDAERQRLEGVFTRENYRMSLESLIQEGRVDVSRGSAEYGFDLSSGDQDEVFNEMMNSY